MKKIISGEGADRLGFWIGNPHRDTWPLLHEYFGTSEKEELLEKIGDDFRWIHPHKYDHPEGKPIFDMQRRSKDLAAEGVFADCEDPAEVAAFEWPNPDYMDFEPTLEALRNAGDHYRLSGFWSPFFHVVADFFGMENYFVKMYTHPEVVHAVTRHVVDFFLEGNRRFFALAGDEVDAYFFGNDFGTQLDLLVSPDAFKEFVAPYFQELTNQGHEYGYQVVLHSCGSIYRVIQEIIAMGVDCLHPLQAKAANMDAERLSAEFRGKIAFMGGVDTQELLMHASADEIRDEVFRLRDLLGPALIISPSHEAVLPNVPPRNIEAMAKAVFEG